MSTKKVDIKVDIKYIIENALNLEINSRRFLREISCLHLFRYKLIPIKYKKQK